MRATGLTVGTGKSRPLIGGSADAVCTRLERRMGAEAGPGPGCLRDGERRDRKWRGMVLDDARRRSVQVGVDIDVALPEVALHENLVLHPTRPHSRQSDSLGAAAQPPVTYHSVVRSARRERSGGNIAAQMRASAGAWNADDRPLPAKHRGPR